MEGKCDRFITFDGFWEPYLGREYTLLWTLRHPSAYTWNLGLASSFAILIYIVSIFNKDLIETSLTLYWLIHIIKACGIDWTYQH